MNYQVYKLQFHTAVHFGKRRLEDGEHSFSADVLFSALCQEALQLYGKDGIEKLVTLTKNHHLRFSDAFPFHKQDLYLPKPMLTVEHSDEGNSAEKKLYKKMHYIRWNHLSGYFYGEFDVREELTIQKSMGRGEIRTTAAVMEGDDAKPFSIGIYKFHPEWGLYFILAYESAEDKAFVETLLHGLELSGIGGKRSRGLGKFSFSESKLPEDLEQMLDERETDKQIALTTCMAGENELKDVVAGAQYSLIRKSGFVASDTYAAGIYRKKDFFMFKAGSSFSQTFEGILADVSGDGTHPVYRYAMPIFLGVNL